MVRGFVLVQGQREPARGSTGRRELGAAENTDGRTFGHARAVANRIGSGRACPVGAGPFLVGRWAKQAGRAESSGWRFVGRVSWARRLSRALVAQGCSGDRIPAGERRRSGALCINLRAARAAPRPAQKGCDRKFINTFKIMTYSNRLRPTSRPGNGARADSLSTCPENRHQPPTPLPPLPRSVRAPVPWVSSPVSPPREPASGRR